jgi:hypothetical protein
VEGTRTVWVPYTFRMIWRTVDKTEELKERDRSHQYRLSLLRGDPDKSILESEPPPIKPAIVPGGRGELTVEFVVTPAPKEKNSELRGSKNKGTRRNRSKQH